MRFILVLVLMGFLHGCSHMASFLSPDPELPSNWECPEPVVEDRLGGVPPWGPADQLNQEMAEDGCIRHYTAHHCLVRFIRLGELSYRAVCGIR